MTFDYDVVVVGGGPAGTSTALHLTRREGIAPRRVALLDKAVHPREKPCAGAVSAWGLRALAAVGVGLDVPHVPMRGLRVLGGSGVGSHEAPLGVVVRRSEFDARLWQRASSDGVCASDGDGLLALDRTPGGWRVTTVKRTMTARLVCACDGAASAVRRLLGLREPARRGHLWVTETALGGADPGPRASLCDFDLRVARAGVEGYYWDFPTVMGGVASVSRGIYHANFTPLPDLKRHLGLALHARGIDIGAVRLKPFSTRHFVPGTVLALDRVALVGEAAGIDASTGEGIAQSLLMGGMAARWIARALRTGDGCLAAYADEVRRSRVGRHLLQSAWLARRVYGAGGEPWREFLVRSGVARAAGAAWYAGDSLSWPTQVRLAMSLGAGLMRGAARTGRA